jgi:hypothetical protein
VTLSRRSPNAEIVHVAGVRPKPWDTMLIVFGLMGLAAGAFHWAGSPTYVWMKQILAEWLVNHDIMWPLEPILPWFVLTNYPAQNDVMTPLDGAVLIAYILGFMLALALPVCLCLVGATLASGRFASARLHHYAQALIPMASCGVFLGLSSLTVTMLRAEGLALDFVGVVRAALLGGAVLWCLQLGWLISAKYADRVARRLVVTLFVGAAAGLGAFAWASLFWRLMKL